VIFLLFKLFSLVEATFFTPPPPPFLETVCLERFVGTFVITFSLSPVAPSRDLDLDEPPPPRSLFTIKTPLWTFFGQN